MLGLLTSAGFTCARLSYRAARPFLMARTNAACTSRTPKNKTGAECSSRNGYEPKNRTTSQIRKRDQEQQDFTERKGAPWLRGVAWGPLPLARTKAACASRPRTGAKCACANTWVGCRKPPPRPLTMRCSGSRGYSSAASRSCRVQGVAALQCASQPT